MITTKKLLKKIVDTRKIFGMSQHIFAKLIGIDRGSLSQLELGKRKIYIDELEKIAFIFDTNVYDLLNNKENIITPK